MSILSKFIWVKSPFSRVHPSGDTHAVLIHPSKNNPNIPNNISKIPINDTRNDFLNLLFDDKNTFYFISYNFNNTNFAYPFSHSNLSYLFICFIKLNTNSQRNFWCLNKKVTQKIIQESQKDKKLVLWLLRVWGFVRENCFLVCSLIFLATHLDFVSSYCVFLVMVENDALVPKPYLTLKAKNGF